MDLMLTRLNIIQKDMEEAKRQEEVAKKAQEEKELEEKEAEEKAMRLKKYSKGKNWKQKGSPDMNKQLRSLSKRHQSAKSSGNLNIRNKR